MFDKFNARLSSISTQGARGASVVGVNACVQIRTSFHPCKPHSNAGEQNQAHGEVLQLLFIRDSTSKEVFWR